MELKEFKQQIEQTETGKTFNYGISEPTDYIKILEPTCNLEFVNRLISITTVGLIVTQQYDYDNDSIMINEFSDVIERHDREMIIELLTQHIK